MQLVCGKIMPGRTVNPPDKAADRAVFQSVPGGICLHLHTEVNIIIRKIPVIIQSEHRIRGVSRNIINPLAPFVAQGDAVALIPDKQPLHLRMGDVEGPAAPVHRGILLSM